jgi:hypothetical protein
VNKRFVIGFGTGRCGTKSLAGFLDQQPDLKCTHEKLPSMYPQWGQYMDYLSFMARQESPIVGNVSYAWVEYIDRLIIDIDDLRVICLDRDDDEAVVESFWHYMHDVEHYGVKPLVSWPYLSDEVSKDRIRDSVKLYKYKQNILLGKYPEILHIKTAELNDRFKQVQILKHVGISSKVWKLGMERTNKREDMKDEN